MDSIQCGVRTNVGKFQNKKNSPLIQCILVQLKLMKSALNNVSNFFDSIRLSNVHCGMNIVQRVRMHAARYCTEKLIISLLQIYILICRL